jgi:hypothetical protein
VIYTDPLGDFGYDAEMSRPTAISSLILDELAGGEKGLLRLVVAIRHRLGRFEKGDLSEIVKSALHRLVVSEAVVDMEGLYSLSSAQRRLAHRSGPVTSAFGNRHQPAHR